MGFEVSVSGFEHIDVSDEEADSVEEAERIAKRRCSFKNIEDVDTFEYDE